MDYIEEQFRCADEAGRIRLIAQLSMNVTLTDPKEIETDDASHALEQLAAARLGLH